MKGSGPSGSGGARLTAETSHRVPHRFHVLLAAAAFYLGGCTLFRVFLLLRFGGSEPMGAFGVLKVFAYGLRVDLAAAAWLLLPLALWLTLLPQRLHGSRFHRVLFWIVFTAWLVGQTFGFVVEYFFFEEFNARFNSVAVDYLLFPYEVFVNIWESYPVALYIGSALVLGLVFLRLAHPTLKRSMGAEDSFGHRLKALGVYLLVGAAAVLSISYRRTHFSPSRVVNEFAGNGYYALIFAATTNHLDYPAFYATIPREEAHARARKLVALPGDAFASPAQGLARVVDPAAPVEGRPRNLVIILVESFGSEFWGCLGRKDSLTPEMDALAKEGILFTNLYASGNRTVRGMEGVLASFPPLPGDAILKRDRSDHVATVARVLAEQGYQRTFLYGGRGVFDGLRSFMVRNGYERFIEQKDFPSDAFSTVWGVADEVLMDRAVAECKAMHQTGKPFLATLLTVSNHKPYTYPAGRIPEDPLAKRREHAVKYTDWAIGEFFRKARKEPFWQDTLFAVVADHGARVYGRQTIPIHSYEIPLLIVDPRAPQARRVDTLGGSLDVSPTLLSMLGLRYRSTFFGRDLLAPVPAEERWAVMHHNRDIGLYRDGRMVVLGLRKTKEFYAMDPATRLLVPSKKEGAGDEALERDATALFQLADELYTSEQYRTD